MTVKSAHRRRSASILRGVGQALVPRYHYAWPGCAINKGMFSPPRTKRLSPRQYIKENLERILSQALERRHRNVTPCQHGAVILAYHGIVDEQSAGWVDPAYATHVLQFEQHIAYLKETKNVVSISELGEMLRNNTPPPRGTVAITFDDGYLSVLTHAAPILKKYGLPATVLLATGYVDRCENQWVDELYGIFFHRTQNTLRWAGHTVDLSSPTARDTLYHQLVCELKEASSIDERRARLTDVQSQLKPTGKPPRLTLSWDDARDLQRRYPNILIGCHSVDHFDLTRCSAKQLEREITQSAQHLRDHLGLDSPLFSYPYGEVDEHVVAAVAKGGFRLAMTVAPVHPIVAPADPLLLPRVDAPSDFTLFKYRTTGAYTDTPSRIV